jgi:hypothetical protein
VNGREVGEDVEVVEGIEANRGALDHLDILDIL